MADIIEKDIQKFVQGVEQLVSRKLPVYAGRTAQQHFRDNFHKGGFVNGGLQPWTPSKRLSSGGTRRRLQVWDPYVVPKALV